MVDHLFGKFESGAALSASRRSHSRKGRGCGAVKSLHQQDHVSICTPFAEMDAQNMMLKMWNDSMQRATGCWAPTTNVGTGGEVPTDASRRGVHPPQSSARFTFTGLLRQRPPQKTPAQTSELFRDETHRSMRAHSDAYAISDRHDASSISFVLRKPSNALYESQAGSRFSAGESTAMSSALSSSMSAAEPSMTRLTHGTQTGTQWLNEITSGIWHSKNELGMRLDNC